MSYKTARGLTIIEGLEPIRRRPAMYIGEATSTRLVEAAMDGVVSDTPAPSAVRLIRWNEGVFTIAFDGEPLPIAPFTLAVDAVPHPELYRYFMYIGLAARSLAFTGAILNALSERLVVSTVIGGERYRAAFSRGTLVSLLIKAPCDALLGTNWFTFLPDAAVVTGSVSTTEAAGIAMRVAAGRAVVTFQDRSGDDLDWY